MSFATRWIKSNEPGVGEKLHDAIKPAGPLKPRIEYAQRRLQLQVSRLDSITHKLKEKDQALFKKIVNAIQQHDTQYSSVLSNELAQIRKMGKMVGHARLALEQIQIRLSTITELGDVVVTLSPAMAVVKNVRAGLSTMMPEVDSEMGEISQMLGGILMDAGQVGGYTINFDSANEEATKIMEEASSVAENRMKDKFPDLPTTIEEEAAKGVVG
ncbi:MAG: Snf7 family protein [Nitrososphaerales archaeon]